VRKTTETLSTGDWVRISFTLLDPDQRAPELPAETAKTPYIVHATGRLLEAAQVGQEATIETQIGRRLRGVVTEARPGDWHTFGAMHPELRKATNYIHKLQRTLRDSR